MLDTFSQRLQRETNLKVSLASNDIKSLPGNIYIAPGDKHLRIKPKTFMLALDDGPKENFVRPAADPLFRSASDAFGKYCISIILTGLGRDGAQGAAQIASVQGSVIVQDPESAVAPSMPRTVIETGIAHEVTPLSDLSAAVAMKIKRINAKLIDAKH